MSIENQQPHNIPQSPEVARGFGGEYDEPQYTKVQALFSAAELRSPEWALQLREQYDIDPRSIEEIADVIDLDRLAGLSDTKKTA